MKIGLKLVLGFTAIGAVVTLAAFLAVAPLEKGWQSVGQFHSAALYRIQSLEAGIKGAVEESFAYLVLGEMIEKEEFLEWARVFEVEAEEFSRLAHVDRQGEEKKRALLGSLLARQKELVERAKALFVEYETTGFVPPASLVEYEHIGDELIPVVEELVRLERHEVEEAESMALALIRRAIWFLYGLGALAIGAAACVGAFLARSLTTPINTLTKAAVELANGRFESPVPIRSNDEIGVLAHTFNSMAADLALARSERERQMATITSVNVKLEREVAERKRAEETLKASEAHLQDLYENAHIFVSVDAATGNIIKCNQTLAAALGYSKEELVGCHISFVYHPDCEQASQEVFATFVETGEVREAELQLRRKDGSKIDVSLNLTSVRDEQGHVRSSRSIWRDVTRRKQAEEALRWGHTQLEAQVAVRTAELTAANAQLAFEITERKRTVDALRSSEELFRQIAKHLGVTLFVIDHKNYRVLYVNPAYEETWSQTCESLYEHPASWLDAIAPEDAERVKGALEKQQCTGEFNEEFQIVRPDGSVRWIHDHVYPIQNEQGEIYRLVGIAEDITERKRLEEQLRRAAKMEAVGRLAGEVAHDFNNLLTAVTGYSELLLERIDPKDPLRHFLEEIKKGGERAATLTKQLLAFSRRQVIQPKVVDLNTLVTNLVMMLQRLIGEHILLHTTLAPSLGLVYVDAGQFEQVIMNLAVNARDAMPEGGTLTIETTNVERAATAPSEESPVPPAPAVRLTVRDSGQGMDEETSAHIFEPFFTTKEVGQGTGLGLAMVCGIVTQSGGTIAVESTPGQGTTFTITLPRSEAPAEAVEAPAAPPAVLTGTETILVVEDEAMVRGFVREVLGRAGYQVLEAAHGQEALRWGQCYDGPIHLLLTDVVMPGMNGPQLAEELTVIRPDIRIRFMTGYSDDIVTRQALQDAGNALLQKPFSPDVLLRAVREALTA